METSTEQLSAEFSKIIRAWLSAEEMTDVILANQHYKAEGSPCCATQDHCDANMAMDEAWNKVVGVEIDLQSEADCDLWNAAWALSKENEFKI